MKNGNPKSVRINITTTPRVKEYLEGLVAMGLHGSSVSEAAERLICEQLGQDLKKKRNTLLNT